MVVRLTALALLTGLLATSCVRAQEPYGSIQDLKLQKPEDAQDAASVPAPEKALVLFNGKSLDGWVGRDGKSMPKWKMLDGGIMQVSREGGKGGDIITKRRPSTGHVQTARRVPRAVHAQRLGGQGRGNSGVYLQGRYEVQVLDSYGLKSQDNDCGGIYTVAKPMVNACKAPTVWQTYDITFTAPKCESGKITEPGVMTVLHNGIKVHDAQRLVRKKGDKEEMVTNTTAGLGGDPCSAGPILLQDHGNPVQYRNIWLVREQ